MTREEAYSRIDAIIEKHEVDDVYVTINNHKDYDALRFARKLLEQEPCDDAINHEDALMRLTGEIKDTDTIETIIARFVRRIRKLPPVNPQPKTGHWIDIDGGVECDKCGKWYPHAPIAKNEIKFCSECGAKMVEPQESEEISERNMKMWEDIFKAERSEQW